MPVSLPNSESSVSGIGEAPHAVAARPQLRLIGRISNHKLAPGQMRSDPL